MSSERKFLRRNAVKLGIASLVGIAGATAPQPDFDPAYHIESATRHITFEPGIYEKVATERQFFHNGKIGMKRSQFDTAILDLYRKTETGWELYNNIVPVAQVGPFLSNAELDGADIKPEIIENEDGQVIKFAFSKLKNGAQFHLLARMEPGKSEMQITPYLSDNSLPIHAFALGSYYGLQEQIDTIQTRQGLLLAGMFSLPADGHFRQGDFYSLENTGTDVYFWGAKSKGKQYIRIPHEERMHFEIELRAQTWLPEQTPHIPPEKLWFETVQIWQEGFNGQGKMITFGYEQE